MKKLINLMTDKSILLFGNYTLLVFLLAHLFVIPFFPAEWHKIMFRISITLIYLNLVVIIKNYKKNFVSFVLVLIILGAVFSVFELKMLNFISFIINIILFIAVVVKFISVIAKSKNVTANVILDSLNGYLVLAILSTMMINLVVLVNPESFAFNEAGILKGDVSRISEFQYYAIVTLTTLGYGEITPVTPPARSVATFIAVSGQMYVAIIVALLVGKFAGQFYQKKT